MDIERFKLQPPSYSGRDRWSPLAAVYADEALQRFIEEQLEPVLTRVGCGFPFIHTTCRDAVDKCIDFSATESEIMAQIRRAQELTEKELKVVFLQGTDRQLADRVQLELRLRAKTICDQIYIPIRNHFRSLSGSDSLALLDVGCGDGLVPHLLKTDPSYAEIGRHISKVVLTDISDYRSTEVTDSGYPYVGLDPNYERFPFYIDPVLDEDLYRKGERGEEFDIILLLTVLHHSVSPRTVFRSCWEVAKENALFLVIESVVDPSREFVEDSEHSSLLFGHSVLDEPSQRDRVHRFLELGPTDQQIYACFIDWFYNRVLHEDVPVPFNFNSPEEWNQFFEQFAAMEVMETHIEGFDQDAVPEFHTLHVLRKGDIQSVF